MADDTPSPFASRGSPQDVETGLELTPRFDAAGLLPAVATDAQSGEVLMLAWMSAESFAETLATGRAVYYSRSRRRLWRKGEESGHDQLVRAILVDCDADAILLKVDQRGGAACHTGNRSRFFRKVGPSGIEYVGTQVFDPEQVYGRGASAKSEPAS